MNDEHGNDEQNPTEPFDWGLSPSGNDENAPTEVSHTAAIPTEATLNETGAAPRIPAGEAGFEGIGNAGEGAEVAQEQQQRSKLLWWVTGGLVALVVVVALFFVGSQIPKWISGGGAATPTPTTSPTAALGPGTYAWNQLFGGECIQPFTNAWQEEFTVVDCAGDHAAQLVYHGTFGGDATTVFPGEAELGKQINALCTRPGIFDTQAASAFSNLQVQGAYPVTAEQWDANQRDYFCFVNRTDGSALTGSLQGAGPQ